jgi:putative flippase GtrA
VTKKAETPLLGQLISFGGVGVINTCVDIGLFCVLTLVGVQPKIANVISFSFGAANSLLLNRGITFKGRHNSSFWMLVAKFCAVTLIGLAISQGTLLVALNLNFSALQAKLIATFVAFAINFVLMRQFVFKKRARLT